MSSRGFGGTQLAVRFLVWFGIAYLVLIVAMGWSLYERVDAFIMDRRFDQMETDARLSSTNLADNRDDLASRVEELFAASGYRFTVIDETGVVLADSHTDPGVMENHAGRPEVAAALDGDVGRDLRVSESTGFEQLYVAVPTDNGVVLRLSIPTRELAAAMAPVRTSVVVVSIVVGLVGIGVVAWLARRLSTPMVELTAETEAMARGESGQELHRSPIREIDRLSVAVAQLEEDNRIRLLEVRRASATLEAVLGALPQGTILFDEEDAVVYSNPSARDLLGAVPQSLSGLAPFAFQSAVRECRSAREPVSKIVEHGKPVRQLRGLATPFADDDRILLVVVDVTERERAASVRRDFVANASHELKTPVSAIIASSDALQIAVERGDDSSIGFARQIEASARQLDRLVTDLLDLSRLERDLPEMDSLSLDHMVREELERIRPLAEERGIVLSVDVTPVHVAGSRRDVAIAVRNLLDNAVRYTGPGGTIAAELSAINGDAVLRIRDTGEGIPSRDLERVFERFYRVDNARARATGGTGLGLAIVKHVIESHGGSVEVQSELGAGSTFTVHLPVLTRDSADAPLA
ncbi:MAG TPA: ATP-binding protein [Acidimicrobiia bacterium]